MLDHPQRGCQCEPHVKERTRGRARARSMTPEQRERARAADRKYASAHVEKRRIYARKYHHRTYPDPNSPVRRWRRKNAVLVNLYYKRHSDKRQASDFMHKGTEQKGE